MKWSQHFTDFYFNNACTNSNEMIDNDISFQLIMYKFSNEVVIANDSSFDSTSVQNRNEIKAPLDFISIKFCTPKRNQHFTESSFQMTFIRFKIRIVRKKIPLEDCAIQSQMPFRRDDDSSNRSAQYKANCPSQGWRILKLQVETGNSPAQRIACDSTT